MLNNMIQVEGKFVDKRERECWVEKMNELDVVGVLVGGVHGVMMRELEPSVDVLDRMKVEKKERIVEMLYEYYTACDVMGWISSKIVGGKGVKCKQFLEKELGVNNRMLREILEISKVLKATRDSEQEEGTDYELAVNKMGQMMANKVEKMLDREKVSVRHDMKWVCDLMLAINEVLTGREYVYDWELYAKMWPENMMRFKKRKGGEGNVRSNMANTGKCVCVKDRVVYRVQYKHYADLFADE